MLKSNNIVIRTCHKLAASPTLTWNGHKGKRRHYLTRELGIKIRWLMDHSTAACLDYLVGTIYEGFWYTFHIFKTWTKVSWDDQAPAMYTSEIFKCLFTYDYFCCGPSQFWAPYPTNISSMFGSLVRQITTNRGNFLHHVGFLPFK